jgi:hypothetical protein
MRIAISTGGGDAPGLNSVIRAATLAAVGRGWEVIGIRDGFNGLMFPDDYPESGGTIPLTREFVRGIGHLGGTVLGSTNRGDPTNFPVQQPDGSWTHVDRTEELVGLFAQSGIDALITVGGDGSLAIGRKLSDAGLRVIGVPKTIDNDLAMTDATFGFDTAVDVATEGIDRLFTTATSHSRVFVVEVMGRYAGWIALNSRSNRLTRWIPKSDSSWSARSSVTGCGNRASNWACNVSCSCSSPTRRHDSIDSHTNVNTMRPRVSVVEPHLLRQERDVIEAVGVRPRPTSTPRGRRPGTPRRARERPRRPAPRRAGVHRRCSGSRRARPRP